MTTTNLDPTVSASLDGDVELALPRRITGLKGAVPRAWVEQLREDMMTAFWDAIQRPGIAVGRGPRRWYVEVHPEDISGFVDLVTHPWVLGICESVLGPEQRDHRDHRDRLRRPVPGCEVPTVAS